MDLVRDDERLVAPQEKAHAFDEKRPIYLEPHMWLSLAADRLPAGADRDRAAKDRDAVAEQLTEVQLDEALRRAREWTPDAS